MLTLLTAAVPSKKSAIQLAKLAVLSTFVLAEEVAKITAERAIANPSGPGPGEPGDFDNLTEEQLEREIAEEVAKITAEKAIANASAGR
jgi:hypothetical protein